MSISVVIPTRNRGAGIVPTLVSICNQKTAAEVIVVDQSDNTLCRDAVAQVEDPRIHYLHSKARGIARAKNTGVRSARQRLIAITDDDCVAAPDWLAAFMKEFEDSALGLAFGNVHPAAHDSGHEFVLSLVRARRAVATSLYQKHRVEGLGACMAMRSEVWQQLGGFDEMLGKGSSFFGGEEVDLALRALQRGYHVVHNPAISVTHHGARPLDERDRLLRGYLNGTGAVYAKLLKTGHPSVLFHLGALALWSLLGRSGASFGPEPRRWTRLSGFLAGLRAGWKMPVKKGHFWGAT